MRIRSLSPLEMVSSSRFCNLRRTLLIICSALNLASSEIELNSGLDCDELILKLNINLLKKLYEI